MVKSYFKTIALLVLIIVVSDKACDLLNSPSDLGLYSGIFLLACCILGVVYLMMKAIKYLDKRGS